MCYWNMKPDDSCFKQSEHIYFCNTCLQTVLLLHIDTDTIGMVHIKI